jgi:nucleotide-binding universal stress UspA family protein
VPPFRRILHPSDFSPASRRAFRTAVALATGSRGALLIAELLRGQRAAAKKQLDRLVSRAREMGSVAGRVVALATCPVLTVHA